MYERFTSGGKPYPEMTREEEFAYIIKKYPQVPRTFILKTDLERRGVTYTEKAIKEIQNPRYEHSCHLLFQWHQIDKTQEKYELPLNMFFNEGTMWGVRLGPPESDPWVVDFIDDKLWVLFDDEPYEEINILSRPVYYDKKTSRGVPMQQVASARGTDATIYIPYHHCHYWNKGDQCRYCDIDYNTRLQMKLGRWFYTRSTFEDIYETALEFLKEQGRYRFTCISGGSDPRDGFQREFEFYFGCAKAIQRAFKEVYGSEKLPLHLELTPFTREQMIRFRDEAGVAEFSCNLEVWDPEKFSLQCPGKAKSLGRDKWIERMLEAVEVFGEGNVQCPSVTGVIMAPPPYGYSEMDEAVKSEVEGFEFCIDHHIKPVSYNWTISPGSYFYKIGATQPPLEFYIRVDLERYGLLRDYEKKHKHAFPFGGTEYRCNGWSCHGDWERLL